MVQGLQNIVVGTAILEHNRWEKLHQDTVDETVNLEDG